MIFLFIFLVPLFNFNRFYSWKGDMKFFFAIHNIFLLNLQPNFLSLLTSKSWADTIKLKTRDLSFFCVWIYYKHFQNSFIKSLIFLMKRRVGTKWKGSRKGVRKKSKLYWILMSCALDYLKIFQISSKLF